MINPSTRALSMLEHSFVPSVPGNLQNIDLPSIATGASIGSGSSMLPSSAISSQVPAGKATINWWAWLQVAFGVAGLALLISYIERQSKKDSRRR